MINVYCLDFMFRLTAGIKQIAVAIKAYAFGERMKGNRGLEDQRRVTPLAYTVPRIS